MVSTCYITAMALRTATEIASDIEARINSGALRPGDKLISVRGLSLELSVAPATVGAAYRRLRERGLVTGRGRQGTRVAPQSQSNHHVASSIGPGLVDAVNGTPDPSLLPNLGEVFAESAQAPQPEYGDPLIIAELVDAAHRFFGADEIDATNFTVTSGSMDAIERVLHAQGFRAGDRIGVEDPGHIPVHQVVRSAGLELVPLPVDEEGITPAGLEAALERGLAAVIVTPRSQNPTGAALTIGRARALNGALASHRDVMVILDDHAGPVAGTPYVGLDAPGGRYATIRSLGKSFGPDMRIALVAGDRHTIDRVSTAFGNGPGWVSHILQRAAAILLTDPATEQLVRAASAEYARRRELLIAELANHGVASSGPSGLNVWIPTPDEQAAVEAARAAGYAIRAADPWRITSPPAVRITITKLTDVEIREVAATLAPAAAAKRMTQLV